MYDPLDDLIVWPMMVKEEVRDALWQFIRIRRITGELVFENPVDDKELRAKVFALGNACAYELGLATNEDYRMHPDEAECCAQDIVQMTKEQTNA